MTDRPTDVRRRMLAHLGLLDETGAPQVATSRLPDTLHPVDRRLLAGDAPADDPPPWRVERTDSPAPAFDAPTGSDDGDPLVSVIVVTYGTGPIVLDALASVVAASGDGQPPVEIIVVDNPAPGGGTATRSHLLLATRGIRLITPVRNLGFGGGCEVGAMHARGRYLAFLNPDAIVPHGWLEALTAALTDTTDAPTIAAATLINTDGTLQEAGCRLWQTGDTMPIRDDPGATVHPVDYASAACWVMHRDEHARLGGFDSAYHPAYYEDVDLALRAAEFGGGVVVHGGVRVVHRRGGGAAHDGDSSTQRSTLLRIWPDLTHRFPEPPAGYERAWA